MRGGPAPSPAAPPVPTQPISRERRAGTGTEDGQPTALDSVERPVPDGARHPTLMQPGTVLADRYRLVAPLGSGGAGQVWLALHSQLGRRVALKVLHRDHRGDAHMRERFRREARTAGQLCHPGIVQPVDFGELDDGREFLAMEYVEGQSLHQLLHHHGALPWRTALDVALDVTEALAFAHARGVIHRDLKPANLILEGGLRAGGTTRILDLGIAHNASLRSTLTAHGTVIGTPSYAAPEQLRGEPVSPRSDLYSLGVILYRMITGRLPYPGRTFAEVAEAHRAGPPPHPRKMRPDRTRSEILDAVVVALLAQDPDARPAGAEEVHARLRPLLRDDEATVPTRLPPEAPPRGAPAALLHPLRSVFLMGLAGAVLGLALALSVGLLVVGWLQ